MDDPLWLESELQRGVQERWCMARGCTTCGSFQMMELLTGRPWPVRGSISSALGPMAFERAEVIVEGLARCSRRTSREAIMWILQMLWERFGDDAHTRLFPALDGSYSGEVLASMRKHYAEKLERRRLHDLRHGLKKKDWPE